jgi:hypothetical protein
MKAALLIYDDPGRTSLWLRCGERLLAEYAGFRQAILDSGEMTGVQRLARVHTAPSIPAARTRTVEIRPVRPPIGR